MNDQLRTLPVAKTHTRRYLSSDVDNDFPMQFHYIQYLSKCWNSLFVDFKFLSPLSIEIRSVKCILITFRWEVVEFRDFQTSHVHLGVTIISSKIIWWLNSKRSVFYCALPSSRATFAHHTAVRILYKVIILLCEVLWETLKLASMFKEKHEWPRCFVQHTVLFFKPRISAYMIWL